MRLKRIFVASLLLAWPASSVRAETQYLTEVTSDVYAQPGSPLELATKGATCIARNLAPGVQGGQLIVSDDRADGVIVANNVVRYSDGLLAWEIRSTFTFEAKADRFRIDQTKIERISDTHTMYDARPDEWGPVGKWFGSGWSKAQDALVASADLVAGCVKSGAANNW